MVASKRKPIMFMCDEHEFLDNFYPSTVTYNGTTYATSEHAFQAAKTTRKMDHNKIGFASSPGLAKARGQTVKLRADWEQVKDQVMLDIVRAKFRQHVDLAILLMDTANAHIREGNYHHDNYWGDCVCKRCWSVPGLNQLGTILMQVRRELCEENGK